MAIKQKLRADLAFTNVSFYEKIRKLGLDAADQPLEDESLNSSEEH